MLNKKVFTFIKKYIAKNGYAPTFREIALDVGCVLSTVHYYLQILKQQGFIDYKDRMPRTIRILKETDTQ